MDKCHLQMQTAQTTGLRGAGGKAWGLHACSQGRAWQQRIDQGVAMRKSGQGGQQGWRPNSSALFLSPGAAQGVTTGTSGHTGARRLRNQWRFRPDGVDPHCGLRKWAMPCNALQHMLSLIDPEAQTFDCHEDEHVPHFSAKHDCYPHQAQNAGPRSQVRSLIHCRGIARQWPRL